MKTTTGIVGKRFGFTHAVEHVEAGHIGKLEVEHDAVASALGERRQGLGAAAHDDDVDVVVPKELLNGLLLGRVVLDDQEASASRLDEFLDADNGRLQVLAVRRFRDEREGAAGQAVLAVVIDGDELHRNVARRGVLLQAAQAPSSPASRAGRRRVRWRSDCSRWQASGHRDRCVATKTLNPCSRATSAMSLA